MAQLLISSRSSDAAGERFTVTEEHLKLLRAARVTWLNVGDGAPAIDARRPYGGASVEADVARIIGKHEGNRGVLRAIHLQTKTALQIALCTGRMEAGTYVRNENADRGWRKL